MKYKYKVHTKQMLADLMTPVSAYLRLRDSSEKSILMESSDYHSGKNAHSYIGVNPIAEVSIGHGMGKCSFPDRQTFEHEITSTYKSDEIIHEFMSRFSFEGDERQLRNCALWGFTSFNAVRYFENIAVKDETQERNDAPDMLYILFKYVLEFDHFNNLLYLHELVAEGEKPTLTDLEHRLCRLNVPIYGFHAVGEVASTLTDEEHKANIRKGIAHCKIGRAHV